MNWPLALIAALTIPPASPDSIQTPVRATEAPNATRIGAIVGGIAGAGLFVLAGAYSDGMCEAHSGCTLVGTDVHIPSEIKLPGYIALAVSGGLLGAGTGALVGAFFNSLMPAGEAQPGQPSPGGYDSAIGSLTVFGGYSTLSSDGNPNGWCGGARLLSHQVDWIPFGPEFGFFNVNGGMYKLTGALKPTLPAESFSPHMILDIGWHDWQEGPSVLGAGAGAGIEWSGTPGGPAWGVESRYHWTLYNDDEPGDQPFLHVAVTGRFNW